MLSYDETFLKKLNKARLKTQYAKIILLSFDEKPIKEIQGKITAGSINVNSTSAIRRTLSMTIIVDEENCNITNIDNEISINKKVKVEIGLKNLFPEYVGLYGDIVWFPQGIFILSSANSSRSTSSWTLSITAKDKMSLLDGSAGGTFPAATVLSDRYIYLSDGSIKIEYPIIRQIIFEIVNHYGGENPDNIVIKDLDDTVKMLVKYTGSAPLYLLKSDQKNGIYIFQQPQEGDFDVFNYGDDAGYQLTDFTYPGELAVDAGETVVTALNKITDLLGNYEFFYNIDGQFVFQEIKNYVNQQSPLDELSVEDYVKTYDTSQPIFSLSDLDAAAAITHTPKYDNIKNEFIVWGEQSEGKSIHYRLAIDAKPLPDLATKYMWSGHNSDGEIVYYDFTDDYDPTELNPVPPGVTIDDPPIYPSDPYEWREELYRRALLAQTTTGFASNYSASQTPKTGNNYFYEELIGFWRDLYDPNKEEWNSFNHWNPDVQNHPENLIFWFDLIDTGSSIGNYSIGQIGRRTKAVNKKEIKTIYNKEVPDILFISPDESRGDYPNQDICQLPDNYKDLFSISSTGASCFDEIREMLWQHLNYQATISISCLPVYYLEPNNILNVQDVKSGIIGNYQITQFSVPLTYNGTMNITATEIFARI